MAAIEACRECPIQIIGESFESPSLKSIGGPQKHPAPWWPWVRSIAGVGFEPTTSGL